MYVSRVGGAIRFADMYVAGSGEPAAPRPRSLLRSQARCALTSGATPRDVLPPCCAVLARHALALRALRRVARFCELVRGQDSGPRDRARVREDESGDLAN
jgi:hypothetical protein